MIKFTGLYANSIQMADCHYNIQIQIGYMLLKYYYKCFLIENTSDSIVRTLF